MAERSPVGHGFLEPDGVKVLREGTNQPSTTQATGQATDKVWNHPVLGPAVRVYYSNGTPPFEDSWGERSTGLLGAVAEETNGWSGIGSGV